MFDTLQAMIVKVHYYYIVVRSCYIQVGNQYCKA